MTPTERRGGLRAELSVRERLPEPAARQRDGLRDRLRDLVAAGRLDAFDVTSCPKRIRRENPTDTDARDRYVACAEWAREHDVSLRPAFGTRECYAMDTGERGDWVVFPALTLLVYVDGDLAAVYPHADGERYRSVGDGLSALAGTDESDTVDDRTLAPVTTAD